MGYQLGIDLGTTYTAAAVCRSSGRGWVEPEVVSLGSRSATVASVLFLAQDGSVLVGDAAERRALTDPDRVVREFKRRVGDPTPIVVAGRNWAPEELSARLVRWVIDKVAEREGGPADRIAITHPASWGSHKKDLLVRALAAQGLSVTFLAEPQAAALHYASTERVGVGSTIAVYDLGGGTFDAAVVRKGDAATAGAGPAGFGLLGRPEGLERLGGIDFDEVVFEHVRAGMPDAFDGLDDTDPAVLSAVARIRRDCTEAKEALSSDTEVSIPVLLPAARGSVRLHRSEFEQVIHPQVEQTVEALRRAVTSAGLAPPQLTAVLLVGGSSRIPLVAQLVSEQLGRPVAVDADPKNAIAKGAALAVAPKPSMTWPAASIPPVAAGGAAAGGRSPAGGRRSPGPSGAGGAGGSRPGMAPLGGAAAGAAAAMAAGGLAAPPSRPPLPGSASSTPGIAPAGAEQHRPPVIPAQSSGPPGATRPPRPPVGPVHESAGTLFSSGAAAEPRERSWTPPAPRREESWDRDDRSWERDDAHDWDDREPARRPLGLYVGAAGLAAVALIVAVVLWWPDSQPGFGTNTGNSEDVVTTTEEAPATPDSPIQPDTGDSVAPVVPPPSTLAPRPTRPDNANQDGQQSRTTEPVESSTSEQEPPPEPPPSPEESAEPDPQGQVTPGDDGSASQQPGGAVSPATGTEGT
jgi:actin-like ATPase involved in cell morphogenesis